MQPHASRSSNKHFLDSSIRERVIARPADTGSRWSLAVGLRVIYLIILCRDRRLVMILSKDSAFLTYWKGPCCSARSCIACRGCSKCQTMGLKFFQEPITKLELASTRTRQLGISSPTIWYQLGPNIFGENSGFGLLSSLMIRVVARSSVACDYQTPSQFRESWIESH